MRPLRAQMVSERTRRTGRRIENYRCVGPIHELNEDTSVEAGGRLDATLQAGPMIACVAF